MNRNTGMIVVVALALVALLVASFAGPSASVAAPSAAPTPVAAAKAGSGTDPVVVSLLDSVTTVADATGPCVNVEDYEKADLYYSVTIDSEDINTTTLTLQHGNTPSTLVDGLSVVSAAVADAEGLNQFALYGAYLCVKIDAAAGATGDVIVTANALLK